MPNNRDERKPIVVAVSGGFDPVHIGHMRMFNEAKKLGDKLVVIVNNDNWLIKKKGYVFVPQRERKEIIEAFGAVDEVILTDHEKNPADMSVASALRKLKPHIFANGGATARRIILPKKRFAPSLVAAWNTTSAPAARFNLVRGW